MSSGKAFGAKSMAQYKTAVITLLIHRSYCSIAVSLRNILLPISHNYVNEYVDPTVCLLLFSQKDFLCIPYISISVVDLSIWTPDMP